MNLTHQLYEEISSDLKKDFPDIENIERKDNSIIITGTDDVLWEIFEVLFNGVENIGFMPKKIKHIILLLTFE